jgi:hypothetical protein
MMVVGWDPCPPLMRMFFVDALTVSLTPIHNIIVSSRERGERL